MYFSYYYGNQADQFSFIRIPRAMLVDPLFAALSVQSKLLYGVLLDRMGVSMRNGWFDEKNRVYIIFQISEIMTELGFSKKKAIDHLAELENFGLVEKKRRGRGLPNILYIKSFMSAMPSVRDSDNDRNAEAEPSVSENKDLRSIESDTSEAENAESRSAEIAPSGSAEITLHGIPESTLQEVPKSTLLMNYNNRNYTYRDHIQSNQIYAGAAAQTDGCDIDEMGCVRECAEMIRENIDLDVLRERYPEDAEVLNGIFSLILETLTSHSPTMVIASSEYPAELVRNRFLRLDSTHIEYVLDCLRHNSTKVRNIRKYLLAALFNAPVTISSYYTAEVNHDMPQLAAR